MGAKNARGIWEPAAGDGLLEAWQTMASQLGVYTPVASPAAARAVLDQAQAAGMGATTSAPIVFLIGSGVSQVQYVADGSKTSGKWNLEPTNRVTYADDTYETGSWSGLQEFSVAAGAYSNMMKSSLAAAPYDRRVEAIVTAYGQRTAGAPRFRLRMHDGKVIYGTFDADPASCTVSLGCVIPANATPSITAGLFGGGTGTSKVKLSGEENQNGMMVTAYPVSMAV